MNVHRSGIARERLSIFTDPAAYADEDAWHDQAARLRREEGVTLIHDAGFAPFWAVLRHRDVTAVERDSATFRNAPYPILVDGPDREGGPPVRNLVGMDGAKHREYRNIAARWFLPGAVKPHAAAIEQSVDRKLAELAARNGETIEFASEVAADIPLRVILGAMGIGPEDDAKIHRLSQELFGSQDSDVARSDNAETIVAVVREFGEYFMGLAMRRRAEPTDDLGSIVANATVGGRLLRPGELVPYYVLLATAGHDTVSTVLAGGVEALATHPEQLTRLKDNPSLIPNAIEEMARWVTPTKHFMRTAARDVELGGKRIAAGDWLLLSFPSANRDEEVFASPLEFDVTRSDASSHLAYGGGGPHFCLGAYLARLELRAFFERFIPRVRSLEIDGDVVRAKTTFVATFKNLPVRMELAG
jgi:cytochrome P450